MLSFLISLRPSFYSFHLRLTSVVGTFFQSTDENCAGRGRSFFLLFFFFLSRSLGSLSAFENDRSVNWIYFLTRDAGGTFARSVRTKLSLESPAEICKLQRRMVLRALFSLLVVVLLCIAVSEFSSYSSIYFCYYYHGVKLS